MNVISDLKTLYHLTTSPIRGATHRERLESFYRAQANGYDDFRRRLLQGREKLFAELGERIADDAVWVDFGAGTGSSVEFMQDYLHKFRTVELADLSESLLAKANAKIEQNGWSNVKTHVCDVSVSYGESERADLVTFSYSLTMIPDWFSALEAATEILKPGGLIALVDFYVGRKYPPEGWASHSWFTRTFWPAWFALDNVYLSSDHLPFLHTKFLWELFEEKRAKIPYIPLIRVPYYQFIGRKK